MATSVIKNIMQITDITLTMNSGFTDTGSVIKKQGNVVCGHILVQGTFTANTNVSVGSVNVNLITSPNNDLWFPLYSSITGATCGVLRINNAGTVKVLVLTEQSRVNSTFTFMCQ